MGLCACLTPSVQVVVVVLVVVIVVVAVVVVNKWMDELMNEYK